MDTSAGRTLRAAFVGWCNIARRVHGLAIVRIGRPHGLTGLLFACAGFWDPSGLSKAELCDNTNEESIGWLRHAEIKHGRVAMAGFVGYCLQANGIKFPWAPFDSITATSPPEQWDALPDAAKWQIILGVGFLEWWSEIRFDGTPHYMKGGKPGYVPAFDAVPEKLPHWVGLNLYDPFKWHANMSAEKKQSGLVTEINNGRLAMCAATALTPAPPPTFTPQPRCVPARIWLRAVAAERPSCAMLIDALLAQAGHHGLPVGGQAGGFRAAAQGHHPALRRRGDVALLENPLPRGGLRCVCGV